jgi:hypothetical protein
MYVPFAVCTAKITEWGAIFVVESGNAWSWPVRLK